MGRARSPPWSVSPARRAVAAPKAPQALFQVFQENLPLLGLKVFLDYQEVAHHLFLQLELKAADLPDLGLHRRPLGQVFLLHEAKQFPAPLGQFPPILPNLAAVLRSMPQRTLRC